MIEAKIEYGVLEMDVEGEAKVVAVDACCLVHALYEMLMSKNEIAGKFFYERMKHFEDDVKELGDKHVKIKKDERTEKIADEIRKIRKEIYNND